MSLYILEHNLVPCLSNLLVKNVALSTILQVNLLYEYYNL